MKWGSVNDDGIFPIPLRALYSSFPKGDRKMSHVYIVNKQDTLDKTTVDFQSLAPFQSPLLIFFIIFNFY